MQYMDQQWQPVQLKSADRQESKSTQLATDCGKEHPEYTHREDGTGGMGRGCGKGWERVGNGKECSLLREIMGVVLSTGGCFLIAGTDVFPTITLWEVFPTLFVTDYLSSDH